MYVAFYLDIMKKEDNFGAPTYMGGPRYSKK
jgi:hypothetical protein